MFTDKEYRILLAALRREREICEEIDKNTVHEPYEDYLTDICKSIERKIYGLQHKYKWHDLQKSPEELPKANRPYIVYVRYDDEYLPEIGMAWWNGRGWQDGFSFDDCGHASQPNLKHEEVKVLYWKLPDCYINEEDV